MVASYRCAGCSGVGRAAWATATVFVAVSCGYLHWEVAEKCYILVAGGVVNRHLHCIAGCDADVIKRHEVQDRWASTVTRARLRSGSPGWGYVAGR